jgi:hypothetical protein
VSGHGHIVPNPNGEVARCGGPAFCVTCAREGLAELEAGRLSTEWVKRFALWALNQLAKRGHPA